MQRPGGRRSTLRTARYVVHELEFPRSSGRNFCEEVLVLFHDHQVQRHMTSFADAIGGANYKVRFMMV